MSALTPPNQHDRAKSAADVCLPFRVNGGAFRGRLVRLITTVNDILTRHQSPESVSTVLAEALAAAVALAGGLKFAGVFTLQVQSTGPIQTLVADVTSTGDVRGWAKYDAEAVAAEVLRTRTSGSAPRLLGPGGHLAFTVDQGPDTERYQGIVELAGQTMADSIHHYFRQSEQLESALKTAVAPPMSPEHHWTAAALLLQRMPEEGGLRLDVAEDLDDAWRTAVILLGSLKDAELLDLTIEPERLLARIFGTIGIVPGERRPVRFQCRCSHERSVRILASFPVEEISSYAENGMIHMTCEFCRADYAFAVGDLDTIVGKYRSDA